MVHCAPLSTGLRRPTEWAVCRQSPVVRCVARRPITRLPALNGFGNGVKASSGPEALSNSIGPFLVDAEDKWINRTVCQAAKAEVAVTTKEEDGGIGRILFLGVLFAGWYGANVFFNIYNKQVLKVFPFPITCTLLQFFVGSVLAGLSWLTGLLKLPKIDKKTLLLILPLACVHTLGNLFTNVSLGRVAVSFTHTIKSLEPFFSVVLSSIFLGERASFLVLLTLFPIVGGVAAASMSEATFNWPGFLSAMGSNLSFQSRNVLSKKTMGDTKMPIDNFNLFSIITVMSFFLLLPLSLLAEGFTLTPTAMRSLGIANPMDIMTRALYAAALFHTYQQVSYMILERVSPVTHSIGNCLKRVIVIVTSVIVFGNFMSAQSKIGTTVALIGVFLYSQAKRISKPKSSGPGVNVSVNVKVE